MMKVTRRTAGLMTFFSLMGSSLKAFAQSYPSKAIRLVVSFAPGGGTDTLGRLLAQKLSDKVGQPAVVDNRPGASMMIGIDHLAKSPPDGYTLGMAATPTVTNQALYAKVPYDAMNDLTWISLATKGALVLVVNNSVPANSLKELIALAKKDPGALTYASGGTGGSPHLAAAMLEKMANINLLHVPFKGAGLAVTELLAGRISMMFSDPPQFAPLIKAGRVKVIAVSTATRSVALPDVPTIAESGLAGYDVPVWYGILGPAGMPKDIVNSLSRDFKQILALPDVREKLAEWGYDPVGSTPEEFRAFAQGEMGKWTKLIKDANIKLD